MSSAMTRRSRRLSGTSPATIRCASPSTIAVLPTPGSPIRTGLFLVRRESTWITRRISSSRPITGSSLPCSASAVRSRPNFSSACDVSSGFGLVIGLRAATSSIASASSPRSGRRSATPEDLSARASRRCSVEMYSSPSAGHLLLGPLERADERLRRADLGLGVPAELGQPVDRLERPRRGSTPRRRRASAARARRGRPPGRAARAAGARVRPRGCGARRRAAARAATASWDLIVNRSGCIVSPPSGCASTGILIGLRLVRRGTISLAP